jgi:hypothetical protein
MSSLPIIKISKLKKLPPIPDDLKQKYPNYGKPKGYEPILEASPKLTDLSKKLLATTKKEVGIIYIENGVEYLIKLDLHCDDHSNPELGVHWHPGVSVYKKIPEASSDIASKIKIKKYPQSDESSLQQKSKGTLPQQQSPSPKDDKNIYQELASKLSDMYKEIID